MIRLVDPEQAHVFIPESERNVEPPLTFHVRPMTLRQSILIAEAARKAGDQELSIPFDAIYDLLSTNIVGIENDPLGIGGDIKRFLDSCSTPDGVRVIFELFKFIQELSAPSEAESKN